MTPEEIDALVWAQRAYIADLERRLAKAMHDRDRYRARLVALLEALRKGRDGK